MNKAILLSLTLTTCITNANAQQWHLDTTLPNMNSEYVNIQKKHSSFSKNNSKRNFYQPTKLSDFQTSSNPQNRTDTSNKQPENIPSSITQPSNDTAPINNNDINNTLDAADFFEEMQKMDTDNEDYLSSQTNTPLPFSNALINNENILISEEDFDKADANHDGYLDEIELLNMSQQKLDLMTKETYQIIKSTSPNNKIDVETLINFYNKQKKSSDYQNELRERFITADLDENKELSESELKHFLQKDLINNNEKIFALFNTDGDDKISRKEVQDIYSLFKDIF